MAGSKSRFDFGKTYELMEKIQDNEDLQNGLNTAALDIDGTGTKQFTFTYRTEQGQFFVEWKADEKEAASA